MRAVPEGRIFIWSLITRPLPLRLVQGGSELEGYTIKYGRTASVNLC
jgi:hypothetical protein